MRQSAAIGSLLGYFVRHATAANLVLVVMVFLGLAAFPQMRAQFFPDVVLGSVTVNVQWEGAGAEDVDRGIVEVLEPSLRAVEGVEEATTHSTEGRAVITLEFEPGWDMGRAADDVQAAVDAANNLPEGAEDPDVRRDTWRDRVTDVVISGPVGPEQLGRIADAFVAELFQAGVTQTNIRGVAAPRIVVEVPTLALLRYDVSMAEIAAAIRAEADVDPAGEVGGTARVRTGSERRDAQEIAEIVLRAEADGTRLAVGDVADVRVEGAARVRAYFVGDEPAIMIQVNRSARGDAIDLQAEVEAVVAELAPQMPQGVSFELVRERAERISGRLAILLDNALTGLALVVGLLFLFLNARTAFWVAAGIPAAMIAAIAVMYAAGLTLNMISLFALIITLGIVVDDAIVVGEHADHRARVLGEPPLVAAENAARRMFPPVFSATVTTVIAFYALVVVGGRFGELIADIPYTVLAVLAASLVECFLILPNHMAHALAHSAKEAWYDWPSRQVNRGFRRVRERLFRPAMGIVIRARYPVLAAAILALSSQAALFVSGDVQWRFFNAPERGNVTGNFAMSAGADRADAEAQMRLLQEAVADLGAAYEVEYGRDPVAFAIAEIGGNAGRGLSGTDGTDDDLLGGISIELIDADDRPYSSFDFVARLQDAVPRHPQVSQISFRGGRSGPGGDAIEVELSGAENATLKAAAEALKARLAEFPEVSALEDTLAYDMEELILTLTPQGRALGFTIDDLGTILRNRLNGIEAATFPDGPREGSIRVELPGGELNADFTESLTLRTPNGSLARLADLVDVTARQGFSTVQRENGVRRITVSGDLNEDDPAAAAAVMRTLEAEILPRLESDFAIETRLSGLSEQENAFLTDALIGFMLCLVGIYLVLAWIFASWTRPVVVMAVIPFGLVGAIWGHWMWDVPFSMFSVVGLIGMTGIIINDSIVLVTTVDDHARTRGIRQAIIDGACDRLRPVLLTTLTTVLGLAPLLFERSVQAQFLKPTVITLVYGLGFGMVLVLLVVPAILAMQGDAGRQFRALRRTVAVPRLRLPVLTASVLIAAGFAATLGAALATDGALPAALAQFAALSAVSVLVVFGAAAWRAQARPGSSSR